LAEFVGWGGRSRHCIKALVCRRGYGAFGFR
jgi:hypothetical protein